MNARRSKSCQDSFISYFYNLQVETRLPVEICRRKRFGESSIFLSRGDVMRKEGDTKRRRIFQRQLKGDEGVFAELNNRNFTQSRKEQGPK